VNDDQAIGEIVKHLENAWNAADAHAFAAPFTEDADFLNILGAHYQGRETIRQGHHQIWESVYRGSKVTYRIERIRRVRPDVAVVFVLQVLTMQSGETPKISQARPTMIMEKSAGIWQIVVLQNTLVGTARPLEEP
jgi:uncharacterized protein (TIGR02246 family)